MLCFGQRGLILPQLALLPGPLLSLIDALLFELEVVHLRHILLRQQRAIGLGPLGFHRNGGFESPEVVLRRIHRCLALIDEVARGILTAMDEVKPKVPMVVRLVGTNAEEGRKLLENAKMITAETLADAAKKSVAAAKGN